MDTNKDITRPIIETIRNRNERQTKQKVEKNESIDLGMAREKTKWIGEERKMKENG